MVGFSKYWSLSLLILATLLFSSLKCERSSVNCVPLGNYLHQSDAIGVYRLNFDTSKVIREHLSFKNQFSYLSDTGTCTVSSDSIMDVIIGNESLKISLVHGGISVVLDDDSEPFVAPIVSSAAPDSLLFGRWNLVCMDTIKYPSTNDYFMTIDGGRFSAFMGCNRVGGEVYLSSPIIAFSHIIATRMACLEMATESQFTKAIDGYFQYQLKGDTLFLNGKSHLMFTR